MKTLQKREHQIASLTEEIFSFCPMLPFLQNKEADETEQAAAKDFVEFLTSDEAAAIFRNYYFDTEVE